jgi:hypothetical protein
MEIRWKRSWVTYKIGLKKMRLKLKHAIDDCFGRDFIILPLRKFIFDFYEGDSEDDLAPDVENIFAILAPYVEFEEAYGDPIAGKKIIRLKRLFDRNDFDANKVLFSLEYETIMILLHKLDNKKISTTIFKKKIDELSPANFNTEKIIEWAKQHKNMTEPDFTLI